MKIQELELMIDEALNEAKKNKNLDSLNRLVRTMLRIIKIDNGEICAGDLRITFYSSDNLVIENYKEFAEEFLKLIERKQKEKLFDEIRINYIQGVDLAKV